MGIYGYSIHGVITPFLVIRMPQVLPLTTAPSDHGACVLFQLLHVRSITHIPKSGVGRSGHGTYTEFLSQTDS